MSYPRAIQFFIALFVAFALAGAAVAQSSSGVTLTIDADHVGLGGVVRPGSWTPMLLTIESHANVPLKVRCEWTLSDADGDEVHAQRVVTLSPQKQQQVWLYAVPPLNFNPSTPWVVKVIDASSDTLLASQTVIAATSIPPRDRAIGVASNLDLGLTAYSEAWTQQESCRFLRGLDPGALPDKWYGFSMMQAYIWTPDAPEAADPSSSKITPETRQAMFEWVRRGGHLVIVLPAVGDLWSSSPFRELLGDVGMETATNVKISPGSFLGSPVATRQMPIDIKVLHPNDASDVLLAGESGEPLVTGRQYGLGRVTIIGVDISDRRLARMDLPNPYSNGQNLVGQSLWPTVFGWRGPVYVSSNIEAMRKEGTLIAPETRTYTEIDGSMIGNFIAMRSTVSGAMMLAIILFAVYWVLAGPASFHFLQRRERVRHAWLAFALIVLAFAAVAWGGALLLRQKHNKVAHFSVIDGDAATGFVHSHSWMSIFSPDQGRVEIAVDPTQVDDNRNTLSAPGISSSQNESGFLDPQRYTVDSAATSRAAVPFRSTAKQFEADYLTRAGSTQDTLTETWAMPQGTLRMKNGTPHGTLSHGLPGTLRDVYVVYNALDGEEPLVWSWLAEWPAGKAVEFTVPAKKKRLVAPPPTPYAEWGGFLGELVSTKAGQNLGGLDPNVAISNDLRVKLVQLLTFYSTLPPPRSRKDKNEFAVGDTVPAYWRSVGRPLDLTAISTLKGVVIIGHLDDSPLPLPLTVNGGKPESHGFTVVRWVTRVVDEPAGVSATVTTQPATAPEK